MARISFESPNNGSRLFSNQTDKIVVANGNGLSNTAFSIAAWINTTSVGANHGVIIGNTGIGGLSNGICVRRNGDQLDLLQQNEVLIATSNHVLTANKWIHVGVSGNSSAVYAFYADGIDAGSGTGTAWSGFSAGNPQWIGASGNDTAWSGSIAQVAFWTTILTPGEFFRLAQGVKPSEIRPAQSAGYWPLCGNGFAATDLSFNHYDGTLTGTSLAPGPPFIRAEFWPGFDILGFMPKVTASSTFKFRRTLSPLGARIGSRQAA
ncbi:MAG: LamG domain-containing protein [Sphingobacteriales bacterium]